MATEETERSGDEGVGLALFELAPRLTRLENAVLREVDPPLTFRQYRILQRVAEGRTTLTALGKFATISLPAVSESVEGLVRKGLLHREADAHDGRAVQLGLTPEGERALVRARQLLEEAARELLDGLMVADQRVAFEDDLREIADRVTRALLAIQAAEPQRARAAQPQRARRRAAVNATEPPYGASGRPWPGRA